MVEDIRLQTQVAQNREIKLSEQVKARRNRKRPTR